MRTILVTGASKGIGQATAIQLAADGFYVFVHYHSDVAGAEATLLRITDAGGKGEVVQFDIRNRQQCQETIAAIIEKHGAFYGVVNNAGVCEDAAFPAMTGESWDKVVHTNLDSFYNVLHPCILPMVQARKGGRIVTLASVSGIAGNRGQTNYSAAKAGIIGATKALAVELAKRKITVNCVAPGLIETEMAGELDHIDEIMSHIPMRRMGSVDEVAGLIRYLVSDVAGYLTRQVISINGGLL